MKSVYTRYSPGRLWIKHCSNPFFHISSWSLSHSRASSFTPFSPLMSHFLVACGFTPSSSSYDDLFSPLFHVPHLPPSLQFVFVEIFPVRGCTPTAIHMPYPSHPFIHPSHHWSARLINQYNCLRYHLQPVDKRWEKQVRLAWNWEILKKCVCWRGSTTCTSGLPEVKHLGQVMFEGFRVSRGGCEEGHVRRTSAGEEPEAKSQDMKTRWNLPKVDCWDQKGVCACLSEQASHFQIFHRASLKINKTSSSIYHMTEAGLARSGSASVILCWSEEMQTATNPPRQQVTGSGLSEEWVLAARSCCIKYKCFF